MLNLHPDDEPLCKAVIKSCFILAERHKLPLRAVHPKLRPLALGAYGLCYIESNEISIAFRWRQHKVDGGQWWNKPLPTHDVLDTAAHELAHLKYRRHGKEHTNYTKLLYDEIVQLFCA